MKNEYQLQPASLGLMDWVQTNCQPALTGKNGSVRETAKLLWAFVTPLDEIEKMTAQKRAAEVKKFMNGLEGDDYHEIMKYAEDAVDKFYTSRVVPKKRAARKNTTRRKTGGG